LASYLAQNSALGEMLINASGNLTKSLKKLPEHYKNCLETIKSGNAFEKLVHYVEASGGQFKSWL